MVRIFLVPYKLMRLFSMIVEAAAPGSHFVKRFLLQFCELVQIILKSDVKTNDLIVNSRAKRRRFVEFKHQF